MIGRGKILATRSSRPEAAEQNENPTHEQGSCRDLVGAKTERDGDRPERLERLHRDRQPVEQSRYDIEQACGEEDSCCGQAILNNERHGDRDQHTQIRNRARQARPD